MIIYIFRRFGIDFCKLYAETWTQDVEKCAFEIHSLWSMIGVGDLVWPRLTVSRYISRRWLSFLDLKLMFFCCCKKSHLATFFQFGIQKWPSPPTEAFHTSKSILEDHRNFNETPRIYPNAKFLCGAWPDKLKNSILRKNMNYHDDQLSSLLPLSNFGKHQNKMIEFN